METLVLFVKVRTLSDRREEFGERLRGIAAKTRCEEPNLHYQLLQSSEDPDSWALFEIWTSKEGLDRHFEMPYMQELINDLDGYLAEPSEMIYFADRSESAG